MTSWRTPRAIGWIATSIAVSALPMLLAGCFEGEARAATPAMAQAQGQAARQIAAARGKVEIENGFLEVTSPQDGVVESVSVAEGDSVTRGQVVLKLVSASARQEVRLAQAELAASQARLRAQEVRISPAKALAQRLQDAAREGATELQRSDEAQQMLTDAQAAVAVAQADTAVAREKLAAATLQLDRFTVRAAQDGTVVRLQTQVGALAVQSGKPLFVLMPRRPLLVRAELNESFLARIKPGQRASVTSDTGSANSAVYEGRVRRLGTSYGASRLDDDSTARVNTRVIDCWIEFDQTPQLRVGQDVRVSFHD